MSLDIKYRPLKYVDVLGQASSIAVLRSLVIKKTGFQQSYLFAGPHGSGKTTMGRLLARALLCDAPVNGDPCDLCPSCLAILETGSSIDFIEVDAATNSGKADVKKITEEIAFTSFSGKRRLYLFDESHQLSKDALDALLKPLEETIPGSEDKKLVCIFCTTEPEKMKSTIISRCAPTFQIHPLPPEAIAERLAHICDKEGIAYELDVLQIIAEITECHVRDALKAVEGVSMLGPVNRANATAYLHLDLNASYLEVLESLGRDLPKAMGVMADILKRASPATCYERLAEVSMLAYTVGMGFGKAPGYWDTDRLAAVGRQKQSGLLGYATRFSGRPGRPSASMLMCDLAHLHQGLVDPSVQVVVPVAFSGVSLTSEGTKPAPVLEAPATSNGVSQPQPKTVPQAAPTQPQPGCIAVVDERAVRRDTDSHDTAPAARRRVGLDRKEFCWILGLRIAELDEAESGSTGRRYLDRR